MIQHSRNSNRISNQSETIEEILSSAKNIAVVGYSNKPFRAGHYVPAYLKQQGYHIIPVNPNENDGLGAAAFDSLLELADPVDLVLIFRRREFVPEVVDQAIHIKAKWVWMQLGIVNQRAAQTAEEAGLGVVMDKCMLVEHQNRMRN